MDQRADARRAGGAATRQRLIEAASDALAAGGAHQLSLRAVSKAAGANVAAVKYHFGSREALISEVVQDASRRVMSRQRTVLDDLEALDSPAAPRAWITAWAQPLVRVITAPSTEERRLGRIIGQALAGTASGLDDPVRQVAVATDEQLMLGLQRAMPDVHEAELRLRLALMASALAGLASGTFDPLLARARPDDSLEERILILLTAIVTAPTAAVE